MKIIKFNQFLTENIHDTPESYISTLLNKLKTKIINMFESDDSGEEISFQDLNVSLESADVSKYSKLYDSLTIKFSDQDFAYTMIIIIDIKEAIPKDLDKDFEIDDIKKCYVKFKKYDLDNFNLLGNIDKNVEVNKISKDFIIDLKLEVDDIFGSDEEFKIETK